MTTSSCITQSAYCQLDLAANAKNTLVCREQSCVNPLLKVINNLMAFSFGCVIALGYGIQDMNHAQVKQSSSSQQIMVADNNREVTVEI